MAGDIASINDRLDTLVTKDQIVTPHGQVNAIEAQLRSMKNTNLESRVLDLEEEVFGKART